MVIGFDVEDFHAFVASGATYTKAKLANKTANKEVNYRKLNKFDRKRMDEAMAWEISEVLRSALSLAPCSVFTPLASLQPGRLRSANAFIDSCEPSPMNRRASITLAILTFAESMAFGARLTPFFRRQAISWRSSRAGHYQHTGDAQALGGDLRATTGPHHL